MHIAEGVLSLPVLAGCAALSAGCVAMGVRRLDETRMPLAALLVALTRLSLGVRVLGFRAILIAIGMQEIGMLLEWNAVERAPGDYDTRFLEIADSFFHSLGLSLNLTLAPI
mgnify:CR=1 FL=1